VVPEGQYKAVIRAIESSSYLGKRDTYHFEFEIAEGQYRGAVIKGFVNANYETFSSRSKAFEWYCAATGVEPGPGESVELEEMINNVVEVGVKNKKSRKTKCEFSNVETIIKKVAEI
jgi:hypothetical protein